MGFLSTHRRALARRPLRNARHDAHSGTHQPRFVGFAASLPWLHYAFPGLVRREWMLPMFIGAWWFRLSVRRSPGPAFVTWMSALIPPRVGPSFWARRFQIGTFTGIGAVLIGGFVADQAGWIKSATNGEIPPLLVY
jgi:hypothetical protein